MATYTIQLANPAHEMAREEILKQAAFLSKNISAVRFDEDGSTINFESPEEHGPELVKSLETLAVRIQRSLRSLERKIVFHSQAMDAPHFYAHGKLADLHFLGKGQVAMEGLPLAIFCYFDRVFTGFGDPWSAIPLMTPTLIPSNVLARCDYFRSFPQYVTFAAHLKEDVDIISDFRTRHQQADDCDDRALEDMDRPEACLSPAVCYHVYHLYQGQTLPALGPVHGICGKCFRYESQNIKDLRRLWDFTMREVVFMGSRDEVLKARERSITMMSDFLTAHGFAAEIRTASDPFFIAPDAASKAHFQLSSDSKYEVSALLPGGERLAVGSHNYHSDFFGRAFNINVETGGAMHSVCVAFGLERWVHAFIEQYGVQPQNWPDVMRAAPEFKPFL